MGGSSHSGYAPSKNYYTRISNRIYSTEYFKNGDIWFVGWARLVIANVISYMADAGGGKSLVHFFFFHILIIRSFVPPPVYISEM